MKLRVTAYAGYKADERPVRFTLGVTIHQVREIIDRWSGEGHDDFKLIADDGNLYIIRHDLETDEWEMIMTETLLT